MKFLKTKLAAVSAVALSSGASFAADHTALITTASTEGSANVSAVIGAVIGIAILGFGVHALLGWFRN